MKKQENDKLRGLFQDMELDSLPQGFENRLMQQIRLVEAKKIKTKTLKNNIYTALYITAAIVAMIALPLVIYYFITGNIGFSVPEIKIDYSLLTRDINPLIVLLPSVILILLMADTLIRKHLSEKKHRQT